MMSMGDEGAFLLSQTCTLQLSQDAPVDAASPNDGARRGAERTILYLLIC